MPESIGQKLKAARESRRLTLDQAAETTRIRAVYLQALENDDHSIMLSAAQGRGFLRLYADFLGLNLDELTASAREAKPAASASPEAAPPVLTESKPEPASASPAPKPSRPGFWARLLRREPSEPKPAQETVPEPAPATAEEPSAISAPATDMPALTEEPAEPARKPAAKKPSRKKTPAAEEPKTATRKSAGKKKRTLNSL